MEITAKDIQAALIREIDRTQNTWMCNVFFAGGECDFLYYTRAGYCHEMEIKVSLADWNNDLKKSKWQHEGREKISYFWYCIPLALWQKAPEWVKAREDIGILTFQPITGPQGIYLACVEKRAAKKLPGTKKITVHDQLKLMTKAWYRYAGDMREEAKARRYLEERKPNQPSPLEKDGLHPAGSSGLREEHAGP